MYTQNEHKQNTRAGSGIGTVETKMFRVPVELMGDESVDHDLA
jgi:hypothetical protein